MKIPFCTFVHLILIILSLAATTKRHPQSTAFITGFHSETESSVVQIGTVLSAVSHMEATQVGEKMRGDVRECCCKKAHSCA